MRKALAEIDALRVESTAIINAVKPAATDIDEVNDDIEELQHRMHLLEDEVRKINLSINGGR